jgi:hypothetical protein
MDPILLAAIIGVCGTIAGAALQAFGVHLIEVLRLGQPSIPKLIGRWDASWYVTEAGSERLYAADEVEITRQRGVRFTGKGLDWRGDYIIHGRINSHGVITFSYDFGLLRFALVGGGVVTPDATTNELTGLWHGYAQESKLVSGRVIWRNHKMTNRPQHQLYHAAFPTGTPSSPKQLTNSDV